VSDNPVPVNHAEPDDRGGDGDQQPASHSRHRPAVVFGLGAAALAGVITMSAQLASPTATTVDVKTRAIAAASPDVSIWPHLISCSTATTPGG
jgi:hypothetical protein